MDMPPVLPSLLAELESVSVSGKAHSFVGMSSGYPLTPPMVIPCRKYRWKAKKTINIGKAI